jgi:sugar phosphate isomerase/epimerase
VAAGTTPQKRIDSFTHEEWHLLIMSVFPRLSRRRFINTTATAALSSALTLPAGRLLGAAGPRWPVGCRDLHLKSAGKPDSWSCMRALGAECVEVDVALDLTLPYIVHPEHKHTLATADGVRALADDLAANNCHISAFMMSNRFDERLEQELECARTLVKAARQLGVKAIRIDVVPRKLKKEEFMPFAIEACKQLCQTANGSDVRFGIENHGNTTNDPVFLEKLFGAVNSPRLGLTLDCANFYWFGHPLDDLYGIYEKFAPRIVHTHCKNIAYPADKKNVRRQMGWEYDKYNCPIYDGDIDFKRLVGILRAAEYKGDLCVEDESLGKFPEAQRGEVLCKELAFLKQLV